MDGILTIAALAALLGVPRSTLTHALAEDAPELRVEILPEGLGENARAGRTGGRGGFRGVWGVKEEDMDKVRAVLEARKARLGKGYRGGRTGWKGRGEAREGRKNGQGAQEKGREDATGENNNNTENNYLTSD